MNVCKKAGRGIIFSLDAMASVLIILAMIFAAVSVLEKKAERINAGARQAELQAIAESISGALVKNRNEEKPWLGAAYYDPEKRRVESNIVDERMLLQIAAQDLGAYSLSGIYEKNQQGKKEFFDSRPFNPGSGPCAAVERFVVIRGNAERKAVLGVVVCAK